MTDRNQQIERRAFDLWIEAGMPEGQADAHWSQAEREIDQQSDAEDGPKDHPPLGAINSDDD